MKSSEDEADDRPRTEGSGVREPKLDICGEARVAETYRLERADEACDDGIK